MIVKLAKAAYDPGILQNAGKEFVSVIFDSANSQVIHESSTPSHDESPARPRRLGMWVAAAVALLVVITVLGIVLLLDDPESDNGGPSGSASAQVFNFEEILDGEIVVEVAAESSTAVVSVSTSIDVVCAVSYGPTSALGGLSTDTDMAGGGHSVHQPLLVGLEPDTEYFYRLQGVGADGRIFASELLSFRTGVGGGAATPAPNISGGATIQDVSSEFSAAFAAANAVDGDPATEWSSAGDGDDSFITIDLRARADIIGVGFRTREMSDGTSITNSFTVTVDGQETFGPFDAGPGLAIASVEFSGQVIRFDVASSTGGNTGAVEIEVYGSFSGE